MVGHCPYTEGFEQRLPQSGIIPRCVQAGVADGDLVRSLAIAHELCPFEVALALAGHASVVISDYNYVFDPSVALKRFFENAPDRRYLLVVDEAHNLPARAVGYYSPELDIGAMTEAAAEARTISLGVYAEAGAVLQQVCDYYHRSLGLLEQERGPAGPYVDEPDRCFFAQILLALEPILYGHFLYLAGGGKRPPAFAPAREKGRKRLLDPLLTALLTLRDFGQCCARDPELFATIWYREGRLKMLCLDPAPLLQALRQPFHGTVFMSATLTPFDFYGKLLGVDNSTTLTLDLPSPFPRANRLFLAVNTVDTSFRHRSRDAQAVAGLPSSSAKKQCDPRLAAGELPGFFFKFRLSRRGGGVPARGPLPCDQAGARDAHRWHFAGTERES